MKSMKKIAALALSACLAAPMIGNIAYAAEGTLQFTDPQTQVGETVEVDLVIRTGGDPIGDADVTMSYDTSALEFVSGDGVESDGSGTLSYSGSGDGSQSELRSTLQFRALQTGETMLEVDSTTAYLYSDETLDLEEGFSRIQVEAADDGSTTAEPSEDTEGTDTAADAEPAGTTTDIVVSVNGTDYNFSEAFTSADIPAGYAETTLTFNGAERKFVANDAGVYLGYLADSTGTGSFFLYNEEDATFSPYIEVAISDTMVSDADSSAATSIILLSDAEAVSLPDSYQQVELTVGDQSFPAWSDPSNDRFYVIYALNTRTGEEGLYQYDTEDGTYQSFEAPAADQSASSDGSVIGQIGSFIAGHTLIVLVAAAAVVLLLLILMIVFLVKLIHRNQELDDLYEEYDIPEDDDEDEGPAVQKKSRKQFVGYDDDDEEDDYEDDYEEGDDYEDDYDYEDDEDDDDDYDEEDYEEEDYEEYEEDDEEDTRMEPTKNIRKSGRSSKDDEDYDIDFIDL